MTPIRILLALSVLSLASCSKNTGDAVHSEQVNQDGDPIFSESEPPAMAWDEVGKTYNREAPIPSQCYTLTDDVSNPCYVCHQTYAFKSRPNSQDDGYLQGLYQFSTRGETNHWINLFKDRTALIEEISDQDILAYIEEDNYSPLMEWMKSGAWQGAIPEIDNLAAGAEAFGEDGLALDGSRWVAFNYKPLPSTFWPTNGATDDVMIRLPVKFSEIEGVYSKDLYFANLALLEMAISDLQEISTPAINEAAINADIDGDGIYSVSANYMRRLNFFLGDASDVPVTTMLYPEGTAFLHSVRYVGIDEAGNIYNAPRMKELRYMVKERFVGDQSIGGAYYLEKKEKHNEKLPKVSDYGPRGMSNKHGWMLWGFIEDQHGVLRPQTNEEQMFCMGCHKSIGTTIDHSFAFPRKLAGASGWGYINLRAIQDVPNIGETEGEILTYLERVGGGDEFRANQEMIDRWFDADGNVDKLAVKSVDSIYDLITPSRERALQLNKAYKTTVEEQSYIYGRDTVIGGVENVVREINREIAPLPEDKRYQWDIRLDWHQDDYLTSNGSP